MAYITYDPNKPGDRERAYGQMLLGFVVLGGSIGSAIYYLVAATAALKGNGAGTLINALGCVVVMAMIDFFALFSKWPKEAKRVLFKKYCTCFFFGLIDLTSVWAAIISIRALCHEGTGAAMLGTSIFVALIASIIWWYLLQRINGRTVKLFSDDDSTNIENNIDAVSYNTADAPQNDNQKQYFFCHKCGTKLPDDSIFCSSCGTRLK